MDHPADTKNYRFLGYLLALVGLIFLSLAALGATEGFAPVLFAFGAFLLLLAAIYYGLHGMATVIRDHERWKRSLDR